MKINENSWHFWFYGIGCGDRVRYRSLYLHFKLGERRYESGYYDREPGLIRAYLKARE